ncbi:MAG: hypothetical protein Q4E01_02385 [Actinomycetaceae bacterium]|nr:hypothetical protein [Actinomycetaceae bacterium]
MQQVDTRILQLRAARKKHPAVKTLDALSGRKEDLERAKVAARSHAKDTEREVKRVEQDLERLDARQEVMDARLASGEGSHKDLQAMQHELNQMAQRRGVLENELIEVMAVFEDAESKIAQLDKQMEAVGADEEAANAELREAMGEVEVELEEKLAKRAELAGEIDSELLDEYEYFKDRSGGIGVYEAKGRAIVGMNVALPESEWHEITMLKADEVYLSEELEAVVVKTE